MLERLWFLWAQGGAFMILQTLVLFGGLVTLGLQLLLVRVIRIPGLLAGLCTVSLALGALGTSLVSIQAFGVLAVEGFRGDKLMTTFAIALVPMLFASLQVAVFALFDVVLTLLASRTALLAAAPGRVASSLLGLGIVTLAFSGAAWLVATTMMVELSSQVPGEIDRELIRAADRLLDTGAGLALVSIVAGGAAIVTGVVAGLSNREARAAAVPGQE